MANSKSKKAKKKAYSRFKKDIKHFGEYRVDMCKKKLEDIKSIDA